MLHSLVIHTEHGVRKCYYCLLGDASSLLPSVRSWICRSTGEYAVSFEVWHEKLLENAEAYYEQKLAETE